MKGTIMWILAQILSFVLLVSLVECNVSYDSRALVINGMRRILISGDIHYPRSTPEMWPDLIRNAKLGGLDVIQTYVFWDRHEPAPGKYYFEGRYDLVKFVKIVQQEGLYVSLRIGPYVCAEWNFGGLPVWLKMIPGIALRTDNQNFKAAMQSFTTKIVDMMKSERLFEPQGGPIIISQIENEYSIDEYYYGKPGVAYMNWAAQMAVGLNTGVPWIMCKQDDAPDPLINTCNGYYCDRFWPNKPYKPSMWTENWTGWYSAYGGTVPHRPVEDLAFSVALFFEKGGSFMNYYMYHGGTNFGRTSGGPFITTSYDYDAPIDEYGLLRQPRWGHLKELHNAIKLCEPALVNGDPTESTIGSSQKSHVYNAGPGKCAAFLENYDSIYDATVVFNNKQYHLPAWSISILPDCETVVFNTAQVTAQTSVPEMAYVGGFVWKYFKESVPSWNDGSINGGLLEQISTTKDDTDYLWYITGVEIGEDEPFIRSGNLPVLSIQSEGHALLVFINGEFTGSKFGNIDNTKVKFSSGVKLKVGMNSIALLSMTVGLQNIGPYFDTWKAGILGPVTLSGLKAGTLDLSTYKWSYKIGMLGESQAIYTEGRESSVKWIDVKPFPQRQSLTWYKTVFDAPPGENPVGLDLNKMGKGQAFVNGQSIGRYWPSYFGRGSCSNVCDYRGTFTSDKCAKNCGQSVQRWYHIPRSWLKPTGNLLVLFEEIGGDISTVSLGTRYVSSVCGHLSESHPKGISSWHLESGDKRQNLHPIVQLHCGQGQKISSVKFASFGTPQGECGSFKQGACHSPNSVAVVEKKCLGLQKCSLNVSHELFGQDPCPGLMKHVAVEAVCN